MEWILDFVFNFFLRRPGYEEEALSPKSLSDRLFLIHSLESYGAEETRLLGETVSCHTCAHTCSVYTGLASNASV